MLPLISIYPTFRPTVMGGETFRKIFGVGFATQNGVENREGPGHP